MRLFVCLVRLVVVLALVGVGLWWLYTRGPMSERYRAHREYTKETARTAAVVVKHGAAMARIGSQCRSVGRIDADDVTELLEHAAAVTQARQEFLSLTPPRGLGKTHETLAAKFNSIDQAAQGMSSLARFGAGAEADLEQLQRTLDALAAEGEKVLDFVDGLESSVRKTLVGFQGPSDVKKAGEPEAR